RDPHRIPDVGRSYARRPDAPEVGRGYAPDAPEAKIQDRHARAPGTLARRDACVGGVAPTYGLKPSPSPLKGGSKGAGDLGARSGDARLGDPVHSPGCPCAPSCFPSVSPLPWPVASATRPTPRPRRPRNRP